MMSRSVNSRLTMSTSTTSDKYARTHIITQHTLSNVASAPQPFFHILVIFFYSIFCIVVFVVFACKEGESEHSPCGVSVATVIEADP